MSNKTRDMKPTNHAEILACAEAAAMQLFIDAPRSLNMGEKAAFVRYAIAHLEVILVSGLAAWSDDIAKLK